MSAIRQNDLAFALGPAGTGKTFISVAMAVKALKNKQVRKIIITRPAVEAGENLGFLPGDLKEKIDPLPTRCNRDRRTVRPVRTANLAANAW